jgi:hypothetical protein
MTDTSISSTVSQNHSDSEATAQSSRDELQAAINESNEVLVKATNVGLFPDTISVDRSQITVNKRMFLRVADVESMRIEDILNVTATVGPVFGSVQFFSRTANIKPCRINYLWRSDALKVKRIAQGYVVAIQREIDCSQMSTPELIKQLEQLDQTDQQS